MKTPQELAKAGEDVIALLHANGLSFKETGYVIDRLADTHRQAMVEAVRDALGEASNETQRTNRT